MSAPEIKKRRALNLFMERLLSNPLSKNVALVLLFGSLASGRADEESDIDLLVFGLRDLEALRDLCAQIAFEVGVETGESVEPILYPVTKYYHPDSLFLYHSIRRGEEVYSMKELKLTYLEGACELASDYLRVAKFLFENEDYRQAADLAHNSLEMMVKALLALEMDELPRTHSGVVNRFGEIYVKSGEVPKEWGRDLRRALEIRNRARYDWTSSVSREEAERVISLSDKLEDFVRGKIREYGGEWDGIHGGDQKEEKHQEV